MTAPISFPGQRRWLREHGAKVACELFDAFGWRHDLVPVSEIARALFPDLSPSAAGNYTRAVVRMLEAEGRVSGSPQLVYKHGRVGFDLPKVEA